MDFLLNTEELTALYGLPNFQQLAYLRGIRPYMDRKTGIVGIKRGISLQSIAEQLYVEPHQGIRSVSYSRAQVKRALSALERKGLITLQSKPLKLILKCNIATRDYPVQNKAVTNQSQQAITMPHRQSIENIDVLEISSEKPSIDETDKADTPLSNNYYFIFLLQQFEIFWDLYPLKKSKQATFAQFKSLNPSKIICAEIINALQVQVSHHEQRQTQGQWVAAWKYPSNWLAQHCWEDEITMDNLQPEISRATHKKNTGNSSSTDLFWNPDDTEDEPSKNNVIAFQQRGA